MFEKWIQQGGKARQHPPIEATDLKKISSYFDRKNPITLQDEVSFRPYSLIKEQYTVRTIMVGSGSNP